MFRAVLDAGTPWAVAARRHRRVNSVIALFYYANVAREMWMSPVPDGDTHADPGAAAARSPRSASPRSWSSSSASTRRLFAHFGDLASLVR